MPLHTTHRPARTQRGAAFAVAWLTIACSGDPLATAPTDTTPEQPSVTDTFEGRVGVRGATVHPFAVAVAGTVSATVAAVDPADTVLGVAVGTWNSVSNTCQVVLANDSAVAGSTVVGSVSVTGNFCLRLYDVGAFTQAVSYSVAVTHY